AEGRVGGRNRGACVHRQERAADRGRERAKSRGYELGLDDAEADHARSRLAGAGGAEREARGRAPEVEYGEADDRDDDDAKVGEDSVVLGEAGAVHGDAGAVLREDVE